AARTQAGASMTPMTLSFLVQSIGQDIVSPVREWLAPVLPLSPTATPSAEADPCPDGVNPDVSEIGCRASWDSGASGACRASQAAEGGTDAAGTAVWDAGGDALPGVWSAGAGASTGVSAAGDSAAGTDGGAVPGVVPWLASDSSAATRARASSSARVAPRGVNHTLPTVMTTVVTITTKNTTPSSKAVTVIAL